MTTYQSLLMAHIHLRSEVSYSGYVPCHELLVSFAFSRKRALAIMCRQYAVQFQLGTTYQTVEIHQLSARSTQQ